MIIQHNLISMFTASQLNINTKKRAGSTEKLSSGYRINRAADDSAGFNISEKMRAQIRGLSKAGENIQDGTNYLQVADGALGEVTDILQRMRVLSVQASNDTNVETDRQSINGEVQQLKEEVNHILGETEFNHIKIWDTNTDHKILIGTEQKQAITMNPSYQSFTITDANKGAVPYSEYTIHVMGTDLSDSGNYGITVSWTGYNGKDYSTSLISWDKLSKPNVNFNISDYLDVANNQELNGISLEISYNVTNSATVSDIATALNGVTIHTTPITTQSISNTNSTSDVSLGVDITYLAELASERSMDFYDTSFIEPDLSGSVTSNVTAPDYNAVPTDSSSLNFHFTMNNVGTVTANCSDLYYYSNDTSADKEGKWWNYAAIGNTNLKEAITYSPAISGTGLDSILSCLNRNDGYSITKDADSSGNLILGFHLTSDSAYEYGGKASNDVGTMVVMIHVSDHDTPEDLVDKIKTNFNESSIVDIFEGSISTGSPSNSYDISSEAVAKTSIIDVPIYKAIHNVAIQVGANEDQSMHFIYDSLRTTNLGIADTNVLTRETASNAISGFDNALAKVNEQRSLFGSYANRLEHAYSNSLLSCENLQDTESRIRDLDMSNELVELSKYNILEQAATAMLAQNGQLSEGILMLLQ